MTAYLRMRAQCDARDTWRNNSDDSLNRSTHCQCMCGPEYPKTTLGIGLHVNASQIRQLNVCWNSVYRKIFHYNRWESVKCCINGLRRMDSVHILAFQALIFWKSLMQSTNRTLYSTYMCFRRERDYMILLRTYNCTTTESIGILKSKVFEHYTSICAAREVTG